MKDSRTSILTRVIVSCFLVNAVYTQSAFSSDSDAYYTTTITNFQALESQRGLPIRGTSSKAVLAIFGEPMFRSEPVGDPPISIWSYDDFKVYFEHTLVITTVSVKDNLPVNLKDIQ